MSKTKKIIIKKTWDLFDRNSFFSISMQEIANYLDIQKSLLYYYFNNKANLIKEVINENIENIFIQFDLIFKKDICPKKKIEILSQIYIKEIMDKNIFNSLYLESEKIDCNLNKFIKKTNLKIIKYFKLVLSESMQQGQIKKTDLDNLSLALIGYLEKINQYNLKPNKNWLDFLYK